MTDEQLIQGILGRKPGAAELFYNRHAPVLFGLCLRYCGNRQDAEDVLHDGLINILKNLPVFKPNYPGALTGWMKRIMINASLNFLRTRTRNNMLVSSAEISHLVQPEADQDDTALPGTDLTQEELLGMVAALPEGYRAVFNMYVFDDFSHKEIAKLLRCSENTSKSQLSKARAMLRRKIEEVVTIKYAEQ